jgi:hypothetical protein
MRVVTERITRAWRQGQRLTVGNTRTDGMNIWLHGNCICRTTQDGSVEISTAGWNTSTTRERLKGILKAVGLTHSGVFQKRGDLYFGTHGSNVPWDGEWMTII